MGGNSRQGGFIIIRAVQSAHSPQTADSEEEEDDDDDGGDGVCPYHAGLRRVEEVWVRILCSANDIQRHYNSVN